MGICDSNKKAVNTTPQPINNTTVVSEVNNPQSNRNTNTGIGVNQPQPTIPTVKDNSKDNFIRFREPTSNQAGINQQISKDIDRPSNIDRHASLGSSINMNDDDSVGYNQTRNTLVSNN